MNTKRRQHFQCEDIDGEILAFGILYDEGNVTLNWRKTTGWTQEQHHSVAKMFGVEDGVTCIRLVSTYPHYRPIPAPDHTEDDFDTVVIETPVHPRTIVTENPNEA